MNRKASGHSRRRKVTTAVIERRMLKNAADYVERSIAGYNGNDYKLALIFLWSGLLLFMKLRLFRIRPVLIYAQQSDIIDYDPKTKQPLYRDFDATGKRKTVGFAEIKLRLRDMHEESVIFEHDAQLTSLQSFRNRVEHYVNDVSRSEYVGAIDGVLPFITSFVELELGESPHELFSNWDQMLSIDAFYKDRIARMKDHIYERKYHAAADGDDLYTYPCPICPDGEMTDEGDELVCAACNHKSAFKVCSSCNEPIIEEEWSPSFEGTGICDDCFDRAMEE